MIESKLQKKLRWAMHQVSLVTLVLLVCGGLLFSHLQSLQKDAEREQVVAEAEEYKSRIVKQLKSDFHTLSALSLPGRSLRRGQLVPTDPEAASGDPGKQLFIDGFLQYRPAGEHLHTGQRSPDKRTLVGTGP